MGIMEVTEQRKVVKLSSPKTSSFSVSTYNILADCNMESDWYSFTPEDCRTSEQRHHRLLVELRVLNSDILCLQEVGVAYYPMLSSSLAEMGYAGYFCQRTLGTQEGLATFYRESAFECLDVKKFSFNEMLGEALESAGFSPSSAKGCEKDEVFLLTKFKQLKTNRFVTVGNIHTLFENFKQPDVTVLQMSLAFRHLVTLEDGGAFIFAGDFNSAPHMPGYTFLSTGQLNDDQKQTMKETAAAKIDGKPLFDALEKFFTHSYRCLSSSYFEVRREEPRITHYGHHPADFCLDYIWYDKNALEVNSVLEPVGKLTSRIPDSVFPSDHLSLKSTFSFRCDSKIW